MSENSLKVAIRHSAQCYIAEHVCNVRAELKWVHQVVNSLQYSALGLLTNNIIRGTS